MRVLLVTWTEGLAEKLATLNPKLEICAVVVDEVEHAKKIFSKIGYPTDKIYPLYDLKECVRDLHYDYIFCVEKPWERDFFEVLKNYSVPNNKIIPLNLIDVGNFLIERALRYYKEHVAEFEMFATGSSVTEVGLDVTRFKLKLFNFAHSSQDLYYNFLSAKHAVTYGSGKIRYALIGLSIYAFHYDLSKTQKNNFLLARYLVAFNDVHNFFVPADEYRKFFREGYLSVKIPLEGFDVNNSFYAKTPLKFMTPQNRLDARKLIDAWASKNYPETCAENVKILDEYLTLCEENKIRPIIFLPPVSAGYIKHFNKRIRDEFLYIVKQACTKHPSTIFLDGWKLRGLTDRDFYDSVHLNIMGAAKFSVFLNDFIEQL